MMISHDFHNNLCFIGSNAKVEILFESLWFLDLLFKN